MNVSPVTATFGEDETGIQTIDLLQGATDSEPLSVINVEQVSGSARGVAREGNNFLVNPGAYNNLGLAKLRSSFTPTTFPMVRTT